MALSLPGKALNQQRPNGWASSTPRDRLIRAPTPDTLRRAVSKPGPVRTTTTFLPGRPVPSRLACSSGRHRAAERVQWAAL